MYTCQEKQYRIPCSHVLIYFYSYPYNRGQYVVVTVDNHPCGQKEAEEPVWDQKAVVDPGALLPGQRAGGLDSFRAIGAPAQQGCCGPEQTVEPD